MTTLTDELLIRIAVLGGTVAAGEVAAVKGAVGEAGMVAGRTAGTVKRLSASFKLLGATFVGIGILEGARKWGQFQAQMELLKTQTGSTQQEVGRATKAIMGMAVQVATGPQSLATALYHIESIKKRGKDAYNVLRVAAEGAKVGQADLVDVTNALDAVIVAKLVKGVNQYKTAMGELNRTTGAGDMSMQDLAEAMSTGVLSAAKAAQLKLIDVNAALAVLGDNNIRGAQAANRLRMGFLQVVKPTQEATKMLHGLHMGTFQLANDMAKPDGLMTMLKDLHKHLDGLKKTTATADLMTLFGRGRNSGAILTLYDQMTRLETKYKDISKGGRDFQAQWESTSKTFQTFIDRLKVLTDIGLIKLGQGVAWVVGKLSKFVQDVREGKTWAVYLAVALGGIAAGFITLTAATVAFTVAMAILDALPLMALFAALGIAIFLVIKHFRTLRRVGTDAFQWIENAANNAWAFIKAHWSILYAILTGPISRFADFFRSHFTQIEGVAKTVVAFFHTQFGGTLLQALIWPFKQMWVIVRGVFDGILTDVRWVVGKITAAINAISGPISSIAGMISSVASGPVSVFKGIAHGLGYASGGDVAQSGAYWVGERGPEIVWMPRGAHVTPNHQIGAAGGGGGDLVSVIYVQLDGKTVSKQVVRQGLMATARRGVGGPSLTDAG